MFRFRRELETRSQARDWFLLLGLLQELASVGKQAQKIYHFTSARASAADTPRRMRVWHWAALFALCTLTACGGGGDGNSGETPAAVREAATVLPAQGVVFEQVDFTFPDATLLESDWGRISAEADALSQYSSLSRGYLNVFTDAGWVVDNLLVDIEGANPIVAYFTLGLVEPEDVNVISAHVEFSSSPLLTFGDGQRSEFTVGTAEWNAQGVGDKPVTTIGPAPPPRLIIGPAIASPLQDDVECIQSDVENVQTAVNQCVPMSVANSLQFLENSTGITVPHDHVPGLRGDDSLVGMLDEYMDRYVPDPTDRSRGSGVWFVPMLEGKFAYLADHDLADRLEHKHQGRGYGQTVPDGDFEHRGITSVDSGATVTHEFICNEICAGEDMELIYPAHSVRVVGCGTTGGKDWIMYAHDSVQSDDTRGLETVKVNLEDFNGDGILELGSTGRDITWVLSESTIPGEPPVCDQAYAHPDEHWPPNHKFWDVSIAGVTDPDGDSVAITITDIFQDEPLNGFGDGNTCADAAGVGTDIASVRAERSGNDTVPGDGRVYHIGFMADDGDGGQCTGEVTVCVPHDQRPGHVCVDQGPLFDSTSCP